MSQIFEQENTYISVSQYRGVTVKSERNSKIYL